MKHSKERKENRIFRRRLNNRGAALVTVIVIILFMSIIVSTLLYVSSTGYRVRAEDRNTRMSFYDAEIPFELIQQDVILLASESIRQAYLETVQEYANLSPQERQRAFYDHFETDFTTLWIQYAGDRGAFTYTTYNAEGSKVAMKSENLKTRVESLAPGFTFAFDGDATELKAPYYVLQMPTTSAGITEYQMMTDSTGTSTQMDSLILRGFKVVGVTEAGYRTEIVTDICVTLPPLNWDDGSTTEEDSGTPVTDPDFDGYDITDYVYYINWSRQ